MQNTKKTKLDYTVEALKRDNNGSVGTTLAFASVANAMPASQEKAPYLLRPVMGETMGIDEFAAAMLKEAGQGTLTEAKYYANVFDEVLEKLLADGKTSVDTGWFSAAPAISGSVPYCNAPLTEENEIYLELLPCLDTRKLVAMMETASSATDRPFDIREVFDVATNKPGIVSGSPFYVFGQSFSDDMAATLIDAAGVEHPCTDAVVDRIPTRLTFTAPFSLPSGKYTLALTGVGSGEVPVTQTKPNVQVKYAEPEGPYFVQPTDELELAEGGEIVIAGGNLPERSQWNPSDGNSFLTTVVDAAGETVYEEREILDEDLGPATGPDKVVVLGGILKDMIAESAGEEPSPGDVFTVSVWAKTDRGTADEKASNVVTFTAKVPA